jgi:hypothetical protein
VDGARVTIELPEARILESSLDDERTKVYDCDRGLFVRGDYSLIEDARVEATEQMEQAAREENHVEKAQRNAEDSIGSFVRSLGFEEVMFT